MTPLIRFLTAGTAILIFYAGGVWVGTDILGLPARPVNISFYILATFIAFAITYKWVFKANANPEVDPKRALPLFLLWQFIGIILNALWVEAGLRFTDFYPWIIAASFFTIWPFLSFNVQRQFIFK